MKQDLVENLLTKASLKQLRILVDRKYRLDQSEITFVASFGSLDPVTYRIHRKRVHPSTLPMGKNFSYRLELVEGTYLGELPIDICTDMGAGAKPNHLRQLYQAVRKQADRKVKRHENSQIKWPMAVSKRLLDKAEPEVNVACGIKPEADNSEASTNVKALIEEALTVMLWMERRLPKAYLDEHGNLDIPGVTELKQELRKLKEKTNN